MENIKKSYSTIVDVPEYSKIIEAENVQRHGYDIWRYKSLPISDKV